MRLEDAVQGLRGDVTEIVIDGYKIVFKSQKELDEEYKRKSIDMLHPSRFPFPHMPHNRD